MEDVVKHVLTLFLLLWGICDVCSSRNGTKSPPLDRTHNQEFHPKPSRFTRIKSSDQIHPSIDGLAMASNIVHNIQQLDMGLINLLIIVESLPFSWAWREGIRKTWGGGAYVNTQGHTHFIVFVVPIKRHQIGNRLAQENNEYRDIILFKLVSPSTTSSVRVINYLHWCNQLFNYNYLVRTTDNHYIRVAGLITKLSSFEPNNLLLYMGYFKGNASVDKTDDKWFVCPRLVPHADEGAYVLSKLLAERFVKHAKHLSYYQSEGASIGLWISPFKNVKLVHDIDFDSSDSRGCWNTLLMTQETSIEGMKTRHDRVINSGSFCEKEISITGNYQYNWHNPPSQCCKI